MTVNFSTSVTPSLNTWQRTNRYRKPKIREDFAWQCRSHMPKGWPHPAPAFVRVQITRCGKKVLDRDNLWGGAKPLIDGLKDAKFIRDDSEAHLELYVGQVLTVRNARTEVRLECVS